ncbi:hypothetical protein AGOR_G00032490 [Albula goreensis]|uniref:C2H2-type domain-containing protein n=1 Tax=Albula goreensis TaxID=1534307 RepID=A0A8T3DY21_9TELE|nr:hypothetical protein AGOR_G00032490 [Albula goreensis]
MSARLPSSSNSTPSSSSNSSASSTPTAAAPAQYHHPSPSLALGLPPRYLHEKSPNTSNSSSLSFFAPPLLSSASLPGPSQDGSLSGGGSGSGSGSGRLSHACRFCGKLFSSDSSLQIHLRSHTGERPYQCPVCLSRFTTRGNLKVHFLRHREQNPELSLSLLPPSLFGAGSGAGASGGADSTITGGAQKRRKRRAEEELFGGGDPTGGGSGFPLGVSMGVSPRGPPSSLPLPPSVDLALLSTAHSLLQLNRAAAAAAAAAGSTTPASSSSSSSLAPSLLSSVSSISSSSSSSSSAVLSSSAAGGPLASMGSLYKAAGGSKRFDENTPPHQGLHPAYSQLAHLPKILFPTASPSAHHHSHHHPSLALLRPPPPPPPCQLCRRLVEKLEKEPRPLPESSASSSAPNPATSISPASSSASPASAGLSREMMAALSANGGGANGLGVGAAVVGGGASEPGEAVNQCGVCLRVLSCPRALRLHQATHLGDRPFPCKLCGRSFSTKGNLRAHQATHRARPLAKAQNSCPLCQRKFTNALVLQHHIRMHLGGQIPPGGGAAESPLPQLPPPSSSSSSQEPDRPGFDPIPDSTPTVEDPPPSDLSPAPDTPPSPGSTDPPVLSASITTSGDNPPITMATPDCGGREDDQDGCHPSIGAADPRPEESAEDSTPLCPTQCPPSPLSPEGGCDPPSISKTTIEEPPPSQLTPSAALTDSSHCPSPEPNSPAPNPAPELTFNPTPKPDSASSPTPTPDINTESPTPISPPLRRPAPLLSGAVESPTPEPPFTSIPASSSAPKSDTGAVPDPSTRAMPVTDPPRASAAVEEEEEEEEAPARDSQKGPLSSPAKDDGSTTKAVGLETDWLAAAAAPPPLPPPVSRPRKEDIQLLRVRGKEYASRSGLKGHMKHHGVVVKGSRPTSRGTRLPPPAPTTPPSSGPVSFWNQYQVFLGNSSDQPDDPNTSSANGSQAEELEMPQLAKSPEKPQTSEDQPAETGFEGLGEEPKGGAGP